MLRMGGDALLKDRPGIGAFVEKQVDDAQVGLETKAFRKNLLVG